MSQPSDQAQLRPANGLPEWFQMRGITNWRRCILLGTALCSLSYVVFDLLLRLEVVREYGAVIWFLNVTLAYPMILVIVGVTNYLVSLLLAYAVDSLIERAAPGNLLYDVAHIRPARGLTILTLVLLLVMVPVAAFWLRVGLRADGLSFWLFLSGWCTVLALMLIDDLPAFYQGLLVMRDRAALALRRLPGIGALVPPPTPPSQPQVAEPGAALMPSGDSPDSPASPVTQPLDATTVPGAPDMLDPTMPLPPAATTAPVPGAVDPTVPLPPAATTAPPVEDDPLHPRTQATPAAPQPGAPPP